MLKTLDETIALINSGKLLHIAAGERLLRKLPKGEWFGGSTEYFLEPSGGLITGDLLDVMELDYTEYSIVLYDADSIENMLYDVYENGFSLTIMPHGSDVLHTYAKNASAHKDAYLIPVVGWVSGVGFADERPAVTANGKTGEIYTDKAVVLHVSLPGDKTAAVNIINLFAPDENSPVIRFPKDGFTVGECFVDGMKKDFADFLRERKFNMHLPIIGDFSGENINVTVRSIDSGKVRLFAPVFKGIDYRFASEVVDFAQKMRDRIAKIEAGNSIFRCSCYLSFIYGNLEGKDMGAFHGPVTFGEVAYLLVNQTIAYLQVM